MKFPNAYAGVKKIFTAEILSLIAAVPPLFGDSQMGEVAQHSRVGGGKMPPQSANADNRLLAVLSQL